MTLLLEVRSDGHFNLSDFTSSYSFDQILRSLGEKSCTIHPPAATLTVKLHNFKSIDPNFIEFIKSYREPMKSVNHTFFFVSDFN